MAVLCAPLDEGTFTDLVAAGHAAIADEDLRAFDRASETIRRRTPCLVFVPPAERWAAHLVDVAVVAYFRGGEWQTPLATAVWIVPDVDRVVGPQHELATWDPGPPPDGVALPGAPELYVDGAEARAVPVRGVHLVQVRDGETLRSVRSEGALPDGWIDPDPPAPAFTARAALLGTVRTTSDALSFGAGVDLGARYGRKVGVAVEAAGEASWLDGAVRAELAAGPFTVGVGPAVLLTTHDSERWLMVAPSAGLGVSVGEAVDLGLAVAVSPDSRWVTARLAVSRPLGEHVSWQVGGLARVADGTAPEATIGARFGLAFGG